MITSKQTKKMNDATYYIYKQMGHSCEHLEEVYYYYCTHSKGHCNLLFHGLI